MVYRIDIKIFTYWHLPFCKICKTENQLRVFPVAAKRDASAL